MTDTNKTPTTPLTAKEVLCEFSIGDLFQDKDGDLCMLAQYRANRGLVYLSGVYEGLWKYPEELEDVMFSKIDATLHALLHPSPSRAPAPYRLREEDRRGLGR